VKAPEDLVEAGIFRQLVEVGTEESFQAEAAKPWFAHSPKAVRT
jgi:hypothetical protein